MSDGRRGASAPARADGSGAGAAALVLIAGVVLAIGALAFALLSTEDPARSIVTAFAFLYPAAAYAVIHDEDPTNVLPPAPVAAAASLLAAVVALLLIARESGPLLDRTLYALFLALVVAIPAIAYATGYGDPPARPAPRVVAAGATVTGLLLLVATVVGGAPGYGAGSALLVFLGGLLYAHTQGFHIGRRFRRRGLFVGIGLAFGCLGAALAGYNPLGFVLVAIVSLLGPAGTVVFARSRAPAPR